MFAISTDSRANAPAPQTTAYFPTEDFTKMRFIFFMDSFNSNIQHGFSPDRTALRKSKICYHTCAARSIR